VFAPFGVNNTERSDEVGDDHEGEEDEDEEVEVGGQQGKDEAPGYHMQDVENQSPRSPTVWNVESETFSAALKIMVAGARVGQHCYRKSSTDWKIDVVAQAFLVPSNHHDGRLQDHLCCGLCQDRQGVENARSGHGFISL